MAHPPKDLPQEIQQVLHRMTTQLNRALGEDLIAIVLYGSAARGDFNPDHSDINLLLVLSEVSTSNCEAIMSPLSVAQREVAVHIELLTPNELTQSTDVFPLMFLDIQRNHSLLYGTDPFTQIDIAWDHLRLRVEQQIKQLLFDLRRQYIINHVRPERLGLILKGAVGKFLACVGALLYLRDPEWWITGKAHIAQLAVDQLNIDEPLINQLLALHRNELNPTATQIRELYDHFLALNEHVASLVDQEQETSTAKVESSEPA